MLCMVSVHDIYGCCPSQKCDEHVTCGACVGAIALRVYTTFSGLYMLAFLLPKHMSGTMRSRACRPRSRRRVRWRSMSFRMRLEPASTATPHRRFDPRSRFYPTVGRSFASNFCFNRCLRWAQVIILTWPPLSWLCECGVSDYEGHF